MKIIGNYILDILFPKKCMFCGKENSLICEDCLSLIEVNKIQYCNCFKDPKKCIRCENCDPNIDAVFTILNKDQKIAKMLFEKSQKFPELNNALCFLIIQQLKSIDINTTIIPQTKRVEKLAKKLSDILKLKGGNNIIILSENYPFQVNKKVTIVTLFRDL
jgi:hypothetical protein